MTYRIRITAAALLLGLIAPLAGCDFGAAGDALDEFDVIIGLEPINTFAVGQLVDVETGEIVTRPVQLTFTGEHASHLIDIYSDPFTGREVRSGYVNVGLVNGLVPSPGAPAHFRVRAASEAYEEASATVVLRETGEHRFTIYLTRAGRVPEGASAGEDTTGEADAEGATAAPIVVETPPEQVSGQRAALSVPAGTVLRDAAGTALSGALTTRVTYFNDRSEGALRSFPGGFAATTFRTDGQAMTAVPRVAGFATVRISDAVGRRAAALSRPMAVAFGLPADAVNPATGQPFEPGDTIRLWAYDEADGSWVYQSRGTVTVAEGGRSGAFSGGLRIEGEVQAGQRSGGTQTIAFISPQEVVGAGATVRLANTAGTPLALLRVVGAPGSGFLREFTSAPGGAVTLTDVPAGTPVTVTATLTDGRTASGTLADVASGNLTLTFSAPSAQTVDVLWDVDLSCTLRLTPPFNATLHYKLAGTPGGGTSVGVPAWRTDDRGRVNGGTIAIEGMLLGETYTFILNAEDEVRTSVQTITGPEMDYFAEIPSDLCAGS